MIFKEVLASILIFAIFLSVLLFGVEVFVKHRSMTGQGISFIFSIIALSLYLIAFCDELPGHPIGLRDFLLMLPGVTRADAAFTSSFAILIALAVTYALRITIYTRLFIIPALTLSEAEYNAQDQVEERANDLTAPILAYFTLALMITANVAGSYDLPAVGGAVLCVALLLLYFGSVYLRNFWNSLIWLAVQFRIAVRQLWLLASAVVVWAIFVLGKLELWRRGHLQPGDELFFERQIRRLQESQQKARARIIRERELLRNLGMSQGRP
jgi:hypothetical protein